MGVGFGCCCRAIDLAPQLSRCHRASQLFVVKVYSHELMPKARFLLPLLAALCICSFAQESLLPIKQWTALRDERTVRHDERDFCFARRDFCRCNSLSLRSKRSIRRSKRTSDSRAKRSGSSRRCLRSLERGARGAARPSHLLNVLGRVFV